MSIRKAARVLTIGTLAVIATLILIAGVYLTGNLSYDEWATRQVDAAGFTERQAVIDGTRLNYTEGPDNGPPLVLIHGQMTDWQSWNRTLPRLAANHQVYAIDCHGHGGSARAPQKYNAVAMASDIERFIAEEVGGPATVAGHSSGGLIAARLAANAPERVRAVVLEDPPFFSSVLPRAKKTVNWVDLSTVAHDYLREQRHQPDHSGGGDFTRYYLQHTTTWDLFEDAADPLRRSMVAAYDRNPDEPPTLGFMPPVWNQTFRALSSYDPRFGQAFYDSSFHEGFDHAETLRQVTVPATLIHTNWQYDADGILLGAMNGKDAARARSLLPNADFVQVDSGHGFHFEQPDHFVDLVGDLEQRVQD